MTAQPNGNGRGSVWGPIGAAMTVIVAIGAAFGSSYTRDQNRLEGNVMVLQGRAIEDATSRGRVDQRLDQLSEGVERIRQRIEEAFKEIDDKLQREMRLIDEITRALVVELDGRLQSEIGRSRQERMDQLMELRGRLEKLEAWRLEP